MIEILLTGAKPKFNQIKALQQIFAIFPVNTITNLFSIIRYNWRTQSTKNFRHFQRQKNRIF